MSSRDAGRRFSLGPADDVGVRAAHPSQTWAQVFRARSSQPLIARVPPAKEDTTGLRLAMVDEKRFLDHVRDVDELSWTTWKI
jgi:hypothetical protein